MRPRSHKQQMIAIIDELENENILLKNMLVEKGVSIDNIDYTLKKVGLGSNAPSMNNWKILK